jgi:integrase/recombinase XerD
MPALDAEVIRLHQFAEKLDLAGYAQRSIAAYRDDLRRFLEYLAGEERITSMEEVTPQDLTAYHAYLQYTHKRRGNNLSVSCIRGRLNALRTYYRLMYDEGHEQYDYARWITPPVQRQHLPKNVPTEEEMAALLDGTDSSTPLGLRNRALLELLYATGIRSEELLTLAVDDLSLSEKTLFVTGKGAKDRIVPVGSWALPWLLEYLENARPKLIKKRRATELFFVTKTGGPIPHNNLSYIIRTQAQKAGLSTHLTPHSFRHACATHLLKHGADIRYIQELLGHESLGTTQIYTKIDITQLQRAHGQYHPRQRQ